MKIEHAVLYLRKTYTFEEGDSIKHCEVIKGAEVNPVIDIPRHVVESGDYACDHNRIILDHIGHPPLGCFIWEG